MTAEISSWSQIYLKSTLNPPPPAQPYAKKSPPARRAGNKVKIIQVEGPARRNQNS